MARPKRYTGEQEKALLEKFSELAEMVDGQIKGQPPLTDLDAVMQWLTEMQSLYATLATYEAQAKALFSNAMFIAISEREISEDIWKKIGRSSTLLNDFVAGLYGDRAEVWNTLQNLMTVVRTIFDNTRTMIATLREEGLVTRRNAARQTPADDLPQPQTPKTEPRRNFNDDNLFPTNPQPARHGSRTDEDIPF